MPDNVKDNPVEKREAMLHPTVSQGLSVARSLALPQIRGCSPLMTRVPWRRRGVSHCGVCWYAIMLVSR